MTKLEYTTESKTIAFFNAHCSMLRLGFTLPDGQIVKADFNRSDKPAIAAFFRKVAAELETE